MNTEGSRLLAVGIVWQALKDYQKAQETLALVPDHLPSELTTKEVELFFQSDWFLELREFAPDIISENILEDFKNDSKRVFATGILNRQKN